MSGTFSSAGRVDTLVFALRTAAMHLATCKGRELELDFARSQVKSEAITRLMGMNDPQKPGRLYSATAAAEIVNNDDMYAAHERDRRAATVATIQAMGAYEAAKLQAWYAVNAATPEVVDEMPAPRMDEKTHTVRV